MNVFQIIDYLTSVEKQYEVENWTINNIHIWPSLKIFIYYKLFEHFDDTYTFPPSNYAGLKKIKTVFSLLLSYIHSRITKKQSAYDVLILDDGLSYDKIDNKWYGKFTDSLQEKLNNENKSSLTLSTHKNFLFPRQSDYYHILLPLLFKQLKNKFLIPSQNIHAKDLNKLQTQLKDEFPDIKWNLASLARDHASKIEITCDYAKVLIRKFNPSSVYVVNYYNPRGSGLCKACWDLSIPSHEIQHGAQGYGHAAYASWNKTPEKGFNTLPQYFGCWQQTDVSIIQQWADKTPHSAYVLGNLYLEKLKNHKSKSHLDFKNFKKNIAYKKESTKNYLITLQIGMGLSQSIIDVLKNSPDIYFWIRMHPANIEDLPDIIDELQKNNIKNYNIEEASKTPLYIILQHVDAHITLNSSTVIEAAYFNIPSLILNETGALYYSEYINQGIAFYEEDAIVGLKNLSKAT